MNVMWNVWHGCRQKSEGCSNCYCRRGSERRGEDFSKVRLNAALDLPLKKKKDGSFHYPEGSTFNLCFSSDFLIEEADIWRQDVWRAIKQRSDCRFFFLTKRIERFEHLLPEDWGDGYNNVAVGVSVENQIQADYRLAVLNRLPVKHRHIALCPLLEEVDISPYLNDKIDGVTVGGESGQDTRPLDFEWVMKIREQCAERNINFDFRQTGSRFIKDGVLHKINYFQESKRAKELNINYIRTDIKL